MVDVKIVKNTLNKMDKKQSENLKSNAQQIERDLGLRKFGDCPICDDMINDDGTCFYCDWNDKMTAEAMSEMYNEYWKKGRVKPGYERELKTPEDFKVATPKEDKEK